MKDRRSRDHTAAVMEHMVAIVIVESIGRGNNEGYQKIMPCCAYVFE